MKRYVLLASLLLLISSSTTALAEADAEELFTKLCISCHTTSGMPTIAPPIFGVINHVKKAYPSRSEFVERVVSWVAEPQEAKALMPGAVRKFGLMPKLAYDQNEVRAIAGYLFDGNVELPEWYKKHHKKEHGEEPQQ